jgi:hypothetical protein
MEVPSRDPLAVLRVLSWCAPSAGERFDYLTALLSKPETRFKSINLWVLPVPELWWTVMAEYYKKWNAMP